MVEPHRRGRELLIAGLLAMGGAAVVADHAQARNPRRCGSMFAIDGRETWIVHNDLDDDEISYDSVDRDWAIRSILGVGADFRYETISKEDWVGRRLIADRFRDWRVFICGDAAHVWI